jgi:hypothetical protein
VGVSFAWHDVLTPPRSIGIRASCWPGHRRVYTLIGILGFFVTGFEHFAAETDKTLLGFEINPLHNIVHLAIGLAGLAMWRQLDTARAYGWLLAAGYGLTFLYGLFAAGNSDRARRALVRVPNRHDLRPVTTAGDRYDRHPLTTDQTDTLRFNPWTTGSGIRPSGWLNLLRDAAYRASQRGPEHVGLL